MDSVRVLVVDDEEDMRALVRATIELGAEDVAVEEADSGAAAIAMLDDDGAEIIVLDHRMPGTNGLETARRILADDPERRVVIFSAFLDRRIKAVAADIGVRACLSKNDLRQLPAVI